jgi:hypothetical protein
MASLHWAGSHQTVISASIGLGLVLAAGCGLRTDPLFLEADSESLPGSDTTDGEPILDPERPGSCFDPFEIPLENSTIEGTLPAGHGSLFDGECGRGDGPEDVYRLTPTFDTDVTIRFATGATTFAPTLRVTRGGCEDDGVTRVCHPDADDSAGVHFLAQAGLTYFVTVDSRSTRDAGDYQFDVSFGPPALGLCELHPEQMNQVPGAAFLWGNEFTAGFGEIDGYCGGPGRENMFQLNATYPGNVFARATGTGGFSPTLSLRTGCGATTELLCSANGDTGIPGVAEFSAFVEPGTYFVVVDQLESSGGVYELRVDFQ